MDRPETEAEPPPERRRGLRIGPGLPPRGLVPATGSRLARSPGLLGLAVAASLGAFEVLHRALKIPELVSSALLAVAFLPILVWAVVSVVARLLYDPDSFGYTIRHLFFLLLLVVAFFAVLYSELGIAEAATGREVRGLGVCLYFSVSTFTTLGYGDFLPLPETRLVAAVEALTGYVLLGISLASAFFLISHHSQKGRR